MKFHSEREPKKSSYISRIMSRFLSAEKRSSPVLFWALIVGALTGLIGAVFQIVLDQIAGFREMLMSHVSDTPGLPLLTSVVLSAVMVFLAFLLVRRIAPETGGSGVQEIEGALDDVRPVRWKRVLPVKFFAGILSLGGGLVLGREGPTIQMGGNIGKMIADFFKAAKDETHALIAAGAGGGLSAAFNAPLAGILFVFEEMRPEFKYNFLSVQAVIIACAASDIALRSLMGQSPDISMAMLQVPPLASLWLFLIFGFVFGIFGVVFNKVLIETLNFFTNLKGWSFKLTGLYVGAFIGLLAWLYPDTIGGGYDVIPRALSGSIPVMILLVLFAARFGTTMVSYGSGAPGGIFAPMLALGTLFGMWFGHFAHFWLPDLVVRPELFAVAGMAALFCATVRAPLTGITLTIEMTGNYDMILPLILTCLTATLVAEALGGKPIYTVLLKRTLNLAKNKIL
ncbi:MAG: H(+)/Cl(-) exchange transporter ClcA [Deltaproteobacteria bacterium]